MINLLHAENPHVMMIQETKVSRRNQIKVDDYDIFECVRSNKTGGGLMIGINKDIQTVPVDVSPHDDEVEILVVELELKEITLRFLTGYGPQEDDTEDKIIRFYSILEEAIISCEERNCGLIIEMDCNAKLGKEIIKGDPHEMSNNGKMLWDIMIRRNCTVVNSTEICNGVITRSRMKSGVKEESVLDYIIVNSTLLPYVEDMEIDESKTKALTRYKKGKAIPSDHNYLSCTLNIQLEKKIMPRQEVYSLRNKADLLTFKERTTHTDEFSNCFTEEGDMEKEGKKWLKTLQNTIHNCFKKVRITTKKRDHIQEQLDNRRKIKSDINNAKTAAERHVHEDRLQEIEERISMECENKHYAKIREQLENISNENGTTNNTAVWRLRRKIFPKPVEQLTAKKDHKGNLVSSADALKEIYINGYIERLKHREIVPELLRLKSLREELFQQRLELSKLNKSPEWTMEDLEKVLCHLKEKKATDPTGLVNELFISENCGVDLKKSILMLMNKIKNNFKEPEFMSLANITSFWKGKGSKNDIDNERGVFILNILRMIKDRLIHNDIKKVIVMSDSQVGARNEFNIRNHLFVIYSCLNSTKHNESPPIDIHMYDLSKCFDGLWLEECCNDLYEAGVVDDKLAMLYEGNRVNQVAVKTPCGLTERRKVERIVTQGGVTGPVSCAVQTDKIGKDAINNNEYLYMYKGQVGIPTLAMIDDIAKISECGTPAVKDNAYINAKIEQSKQLFNGTKCHAMHVGKHPRPCCTLKAHNTEMEVVDKEKYVGDVVSNDMKHTKNIMARRSKGMGMIGEITNILDGLCLGAHYFTSAMMMRQSMLIQVLLTNSETWLRLTQKDIVKLEGADRTYLRRIFRVPNSTPIPFLYLETGSIPIRFVLKMRRIMYLHHILTRKADALISQVFWAQVNQPVKGDWCIVVKEDLENIGLGHLSFDDIKSLSEDQLKIMVKIKIKETAFNSLLKDKERCSKLKTLKYNSLEIQPYLTTDSKLTIQMKQMMFRWRSHTINVKQNIGVKDAMCPLCKEADDTQYHLLRCRLLSNPEPWTIGSVMQALRQRETILEQWELEKQNNKDNSYAKIKSNN